MTKDLKAGQRVTLIIEGTIDDTYGPNYDLAADDSIAIELADGNTVYIETQGYLADLDIQVTREFPEGLYYDAAGPDSPFSQVSLVFKREGLTWYDHRLDPIVLSPETEAGLVRLGSAE